MRSILGAALAVVCAGPMADVTITGAPPLSRGLKFSSSRRYRNRGTGDGRDGALQREAKKRAGQRQFYAELDGRKAGA